LGASRMDEAVARRLAAINMDFYARAAQGFSATRRAPWPGWRTIAESIRVDLPSKCLGCADAPGCPHATDVVDKIRVADLACGNLRFEAFLEHELPDVQLRFHVVDCCGDFDAEPVALPYTVGIWTSCRI